MKKKKYLLLTILCSMLFTSNISAKEIYYENKNGVVFTKEEYDFLLGWKSRINDKERLQ